MKVTNGQAIAETIMTFEMGKHRISLWKLTDSMAEYYGVVNTITGKIMDCISLEHALDMFDLTVKPYCQKPLLN